LKEFPIIHKSKLVSIAMSESPAIIMSCDTEGEVKIWSLTGQVLSSIKALQMAIYMASLSNDSRFVTVAAFTSELRVWEVVCKPTGEFDKFHKVLDLTGSKSGFHWADFSEDSTRVIGACKDGSWRIWRINVKYEAGAQPERLTVGQTKSDPAKWICFSPDGKKIATVSGGNLQLWDVEGKFIGEIGGQFFKDALAVYWVPKSNTLMSITKEQLFEWKPKALQKQ